MVRDVLASARLGPIRHVCGARFSLPVYTTFLCAFSGRAAPRDAHEACSWGVVEVEPSEAHQEMDLEPGGSPETMAACERPLSQRDSWFVGLAARAHPHGGVVSEEELAELDIYGTLREKHHRMSAESVTLLYTEVAARSCHLLSGLDAAQLRAPCEPSINPFDWSAAHVAHFYGARCPGVATIHALPFTRGRPRGGRVQCASPPACPRPARAGA